MAPLSQTPTIPKLAAITCAVPDIVFGQDEVAALAKSIFASANDGTIERLMPIFANSGIDRRYSCVPLDWYTKPHSWAERNRLYIDNALILLERSARACLTKVGLAATAIDAVVLVSTTGIATPSLEARLMDRLDLRRDCQRLPIFGLGCAGGVLGLSRAAALARAMPGARILVLAVELCGLTFRANDPSKSNVVATALFGDGAAAMIISSHPDDDGPAIAEWGEYCWPDSRDVMGWNVEDDGLGVMFSRDIPTLVRRDLPARLDDFLAQKGLKRGDIDRYICHPGGAKVVDALEEALHLPAQSLIHEREILRLYGNMSAVTVLFVLNRAMENSAPLAGRSLMTALGPGFTAAFAILESGPR